MLDQVSLYIPSYNAEKYIASAIEGALRQTRVPDEILVVDDGSRDRTAEVASRFPVRVIRHECNKGLAAARNTAFRNSRYPLVAGVDADVVPATDWLESLYHNFEQPGVAAAGGVLIEQFHEAPADHWRFLYLTHGATDERTEITWPSHRRLGGFASLMRKSAVEQVGGYDERYRTAYDDHDISLKLLRAGYTLVFEPKAISHHIRRDTIYSVVRTAWNWQFWGLYYKGHYNSILRKIGSNFWAAVRMVRRHWHNGTGPSLLPVDLAYPCLHSYWDFRYYFSAARLPSPSSKACDDVH